MERTEFTRTLYFPLVLTTAVSVETDCCICVWVMVWVLMVMGISSWMSFPDALRAVVTAPLILEAQVFWSMVRGRAPQIQPKAAGALSDSSLLLMLTECFFREGRTAFFSSWIVLWTLTLWEAMTLAGVPLEGGMWIRSKKAEWESGVLGNCAMDSKGLGLESLEVGIRDILGK